MAKKFKTVKQKKLKTWLAKTMNRVLLPAYAAGLMVIIVTLLLLIALDLSNLVYAIATAVYFVLLLSSAFVIIFVIIPRCRAKQALIDLKNYDFTPHAVTDREKFSFDAKTQKYYYSPSPFDFDEGTVELADGDAADGYFSQFAPERLKKYEELRIIGEFNPFEIYVFFGNIFLGGSVEKKIEGGFVTVTVTERYNLTFESDGAHLGDKIFPYFSMQADALAYFVQNEARATVRLNLYLGDGESDETYIASFAFGARIAAIIDKYKIPVENREVFDCILSDPKEAFRTLGLKRKLKIKSTNTENL